MLNRTHVRASLVAAVAFIVFLGLALERSQGRLAAEEQASPSVTADDLAAAAHAKVFFEHQSVGKNVIDGIPAVYASGGARPPAILEVPNGRSGGAADQLRGRQGYFAHAFFGQNGDPIAKLEDFDATIRGGVGSQVDVAFMKFCYVDIDSRTDVAALFRRYTQTMAGLERDFPHVTFLKVTTPVTTERSVKSRVKALLGRDDHMGPADNAARERFNALLRSEYAGDDLFDLAALESTAPDGSRVTGTYHGSRYYELYPDYAADAGHLNALGSKIAAARLIEVVARASAGRPA